MEDYEKSLHITDEAFEGVMDDADRVLQRLMKNMIDKESLEGKVTITVDVSLIREYIQNTDPKIVGETRPVYTPKFEWKVGSAMQIKDETKGKKNFDGNELVWDEDLKEYILKPIANTEQCTIFDAEYRCVNDEEEENAEFVEDQPALEGRFVAALPGPETEEDEEILEETVEDEANDFIEVTEVESDDMSEEFDGMPLPFSEAEVEEYEYEDPEEEEF